MDNGMDNRDGAQDLRRDRRFQVSQAALITRSGGPDIACEIRDFCLGGMFLKFSDPDAALASLAQASDAEVGIAFTPASINIAQTFHVPARVRRVSPLGVGVAFVRQPVEALRALQKLRMADHRQKLATQSPSDANPRLREIGATLLRETLLQAHDQVTRMLGDHLAAAAVHASTINEHSQLLSAPHEFSSRAIAVQTRFVEQVIGALNPGRPVQTQATRQTEGDLALVDEFDFEDWLAMSSEATRLEEQFEEQLADIEPRVGQLYAFACDHGNNPFGPAVIGHAYRAALQDIPVPARARQVAYGVLREVLAEQLPLLYAEVLALLPVSHVEARRAHAVRNPPPPPAQSSTPPAGPAQHTLGRLAGSLLDFFRGDANIDLPASGAGSDGYFTAARAASSALPAAASNPAAGAVGATPSPANLPVLQRLASAGALPTAETDAMQRSVEMFGALFDTVHAEKSLGAGMRPFFHQLETSLIKLAMSDPQFLASPAHPAHKVLNTLDRISMVAGDDGKITDPRLTRLMNRWTERINAEADKNPGVFDEARTQLERVVKPLLSERSARIFRLQEMCEGRQSAEVAKQRIVRELLARLDAHEVPAVVIELLNGGWRNVLLIAELRHGVDSEDARDAWQVVQRLCEWLDPDRTEQPAAREIQTLLQRVDQALIQVCADKFAQDRIVDQLATALFDEDKSRHPRTSLAARLSDAACEPLSAVQDGLAERLRVGDWLQFKGFDAPLNLIWIGDQPPVYVFANYRGVKKLDLKRSDLLQALEDGTAYWAADLELPLMDRSYSAMIQKMQRDLLWKASHDATTGLANRKSFFRSIRRDWLRNHADESGYAIAVIRLEISKPEGGTAAAHVCATILQEFARQLPAQLPPGALLARAGESGIAFRIKAVDGAAAQADTERLLPLAGSTREIDGVRYGIEAWAGLMWAPDCLDPEAYYDNANAACSRARESGAALVVYDGTAGDSGVLALAHWAHELTDILAHNQLSLNCQPVVALGEATRSTLYYEVLLHPTTRSERNIATGELISVAERLQRITEIDRWVVRHVLQWMRAHADTVDGIGGLSIKLSGQSVSNPLFLKLLLADLSRGDLPGEKLIFEISEADAVEGHAQTQLFIRQLQRYGCRFMLDDFGVGSSSYTSLKGMRLDYLKIDRALVREVSTSMIDEALVRSILETAGFLGIKTVAGFVEDAETLAKLREMGVECVQGYLIGEPRALETLA